MNTVTVESVIGLRHWPDQYHESFSFINGMVRSPKPVVRHGIGALGNFQPQAIGKRVHKGQVENEMQIIKRTGMNTDRREQIGKMLIAQAREFFMGQLNIWGHKI